MRDTDLTRLARWVIPGWLYFALVTIFVVVDFAISSPRTIRAVLSILRVGRLGFEQILIVITLVTAASVPVGFLVYQSYFWLRWNSPFSANGLFLFGPGRKWDLKFITSDLEFSVDLSTREALRKKQDYANKFDAFWLTHKFYGTEHRFTWAYSEIKLFEHINDKVHDKGFSWWQRHRYLHEVVHVLGASLSAIGLSYFSYVTGKIYWELFMRRHLIIGLEKPSVLFRFEYLLIPILVTLTLHMLLHRERSGYRNHLLMLDSNDSKGKNGCCCECNRKSECAQNMEKMIPYCLKIHVRTQFFNKAVAIFTERAKMALLRRIKIHATIFVKIARPLRTLLAQFVQYVRTCCIVFPYPSYLFVASLWIISITLFSARSLLSLDNTSNQTLLLLRWVIFFLIALGFVVPWAIVYHHPDKGVRWGNFIFVGMVFIFMIISSAGSIAIYKQMDVGFWINTLIYAFTWLVVFSNREGARFDMLSLEKYLLMKYSK